MLANSPTAFARNLRRRQTDLERKTWRALRNRRFQGLKFRRQHPIGRYIVDFVCEDVRLVIELDGGQHAENKAYDEGRSAYLRCRGYEVLRFWNNEAGSNLEGVLAAIALRVAEKRNAE